jgi:uncharacterized protein YdaU (DUF1376 family)
MMPATKAPAFQFYPKDYLTDPNVRMMTFEQRGIYVELLCLCWLQGDLPGDVGELAKMTGLQRWRFDKAWVGIRRCFIENTGRLRHKRLDRERAVQQAFSAERSRSGKKGAERRWEASRDGSAIAEPLAEPMALDGSSSASASASAKKEKKTRKPRVFSGSSFSMTEKQHAVVIGPLGKSGDGFDYLPVYEAADAEWCRTQLPTDVLGALKLRVRQAFERQQPDMLPARDPVLVRMDEWAREADAGKAVANG